MILDNSTDKMCPLQMERADPNGAHGQPESHHGASWEGECRVVSQLERHIMVSIDVLAELAAVREVGVFLQDFPMSLPLDGSGTIVIVQYQV